MSGISTGGGISYVPGSTPPAAANPTASVGTAAVNGSAQTFMRSDAAPPVDQAIAPAWTGLHTFNGGNAPGSPSIVLGDIAPELRFFRIGNAVDQKYWRVLPTTTTYNIQTGSDANPTTGQVGYSMVRSGTAVTQHVFLTGATARLSITDTDIATGAGYAPANPASVATKQYVDSAVPTLSSGTYTPTVLYQNGATVSFISSSFFYQRIGNVVSVTGGAITIAAASTSSAGVIRISLPIASSFSNSLQLEGFATTILAAGVGTASIASFPSDNSATFTLWATNTSANDYGITFSYTVQ